MIKYKKLLYPIIAILIAFVVGFCLLAISKDPLAAYKIGDLLWGNFRSKSAFLNFLGYLSVYSLVGVAVAFGFKGNIFNIGVSGQMMFAGTISYIAITWGNLKLLNPVFILILCILAAMLLGLFTILLKIYGNIHEVVSTIMLNWAALYFYQFVLENSPQLANDGSSINIDPSLLINLNVKGVVTSTFNIGVFIALFLIISFWALFRFTSLGYKITIVGINPKASKYAGVKNNRIMMQTMLISAAIAGLAGFVYYYGIKKFLPVQSLPVPIGFDGITVALLANNNFIGIIFSALFVSSIYTQKIVMSGNKEIVDTIIAITLLAIASSAYFLSKPKLKMTRWYLQIIAKRENQLKISYYGVRWHYLLILLFKDRLRIRFYLLRNKISIYYDFFVTLVINNLTLLFKNQAEFLLEKLAIRVNKRLQMKRYYEDYQIIINQKQTLYQSVFILNPKKEQFLTKKQQQLLKKLTRKIQIQEKLVMKLAKKVPQIDQVQQKNILIWQNRIKNQKTNAGAKVKFNLKTSWNQLLLKYTVSQQQKKTLQFKNKKAIIIKHIKEVVAND